MFELEFGNNTQSIMNQEAARITYGGQRTL